MNKRVLVVDDYEPWRRHVAAELDKSDRWEIVGELEDGVEAVREAKALKPDIILIDIGLKTLNGVEAARQILADDPTARILILTGQNSPDIADAALAAGARGYLIKHEAGGKLLLAMEAVVAGARFLSPGLPAEVLDRSRTPGTRTHRHEAVFRSDAAGLVDDYARFAEAALAGRQPVVVVAPRDRLDKLRQRLESHGVPVARHVRDGSYVTLEMDLETLMPDGRCDEDTIRRSAAEIVAIATRNAEPDRRVAMCGEVAPQLWRNDRADATIRIERIWDEIARSLGIDLFCGYLVDAARVAEQEYGVFRDVCAAHGTVHVR